MSLENDELLAIFVEEARQLLDAIAIIVEHWSEDFNNKAIFEELKRDLHTLKGASRMVNQSELSALAHQLESVADGLLHEKIQANQQSYELVCVGLDRMNTLLEALSDKSIVKIAEQEPVEVRSIASKERIRVKIDVLEKLNNLSLENNIARVNTGHYIGNLKSNIDEIFRIIKIFQGKLRLASIKENLNVTSEVMALIHIGKTLKQIHSSLDSLLSEEGRIAHELQDGLMDTRMVPFNSIVPRLGRIARQVAQELNKKVDFKILAPEGEIDRNLLEHLVPSIEHLLRNAIDHGIEPPSERIKLGKLDTGKINLRLFRIGNDAGVEIMDDGAGINIASVHKKAIELGLLKENAEISDFEILRYILEPGFSTREHVSEISGRGIGMDVVNAIVKELGGNLLIESTLGKGTKFTIRLPFTTSMNRVLLVVVMGQMYAVLLSFLENIVLMNAKQVKESLDKESIIFFYDNKEYQLKYLGALLGVQQAPIFANLKESLPIMFFTFPNYKLALLVDGINGSEEVVIQSLGPQFKLIDSFSGAILLSDGRVVVVLDIYSMVEKALKYAPESRPKFQPALQKSEKKIHTVLVVDDSLTIRSITKNFLERHKYIVITAKDGFEALAKIKNSKPDIILLDIEMPRMNGFELVKKLKENPKLYNIPIIIITFNVGEEQKALASKLGVEQFMTKPYKEHELLESIWQLLGYKHD